MISVLCTEHATTEISFYEIEIFTSHLLKSQYVHKSVPQPTIKQTNKKKNKSSNQSILFTLLMVPSNAK